MKYAIVRKCIDANQVRNSLEELRKQIQVVALAEGDGRILTDADWMKVQRCDFMYWETELRRLVQFFV